MNYRALPPRTLGAFVRAGDSGACHYVRRAVAATDGAVAPAARALGVSRRALTLWLALPHLSDVQTIDRATAARRPRKRQAP